MVWYLLMYSTNMLLERLRREGGKGLAIARIAIRQANLGLKLAVGNRKLPLLILTS